MWKTNDHLHSKINVVVDEDTVTNRINLSNARYIRRQHRTKCQTLEGLVLDCLRLLAELSEEKIVPPPLSFKCCLGHGSSLFEQLLCGNLPKIFGDLGSTGNSGHELEKRIPPQRTRVKQRPEICYVYSEIRHCSSISNCQNYKGTNSC